MPDENRVFDVSRPGSVGPQPNSKPVIVGHHPTIGDPMVNTEAAPTHIVVQGAHPENTLPEQTHQTPMPAPESESSIISNPFGENSISAEPQDQVSETHSAVDAEPLFSPEPSGLEPNEETIPPLETELTHPADSMGHVEELHVSSPRRRKRPLAWITLSLLILLVAGYLLIDSGIVKTGLNLPFHVFKQPAAAPVVKQPGPSTQSKPVAKTIPAGFTQYKLAGTSISFAAPTAWGSPTSSQSEGYTVRGGTNKADATYAYIVDFATNKDVQIAVTSAKVLPPARTALYYDFLQWCTGTSDDKTYLSILRFSTTNKIDTPSTITCDQGPLATATKLDSSTIVELKVKATDGKLLGDLYTKNLTNSDDLPVLRVKDQASANGELIKKLLATVQTNAASSTTP